MFAIEEGSEAFARLQQIVSNPDTYKVSIAVQRGTETNILLKRNEGMWSAPLPVVQIAGDGHLG